MAEITFSLDVSGNTETLIIPVFLRIEPFMAQSRMAPQYVVLYDAKTGAAIQEYQTKLNSQSSTFEFKDLNPGSYFIMGGSDVDQDNLICQQGETCGAWPDLVQVEAFEYSGQLLNRDITVNVQSKLNYTSDDIQVSNGLKVKLSSLNKRIEEPQKEDVPVSRRAP